MLAVFIAGGAYCPLDAAAPEKRTGVVVGNLQPRALIIDTDPPSDLPAGVTVLDSGCDILVPGWQTDVPAGEPRPDHLAYVIHTSGSTGRPKGVAMSHRGLSRLLRWQIGSGPPGLRTLHYTATGFDVTFQEVLSTLATGGTLVMTSDEVRRNPALLLDALQKHAVQRLFLPYVALQQLASAAQASGIFPETLEHVVTAGERLIITDAIAEFFGKIPGCRLDNHYGPTEAHLVTNWTLPADRAAWPSLPPIGAAVDEVDCRVLDGESGPVPPGDIGELYIGGPGLARGYVNDPGLTAERFVPDPFGPPGSRLYRTGDLVRITDDDLYDFVGRADNQLKVRGFRVEPAEVEAAILTHPRITAAAVGLREVAEGVCGLVAYLTVDSPVSQHDLVSHLRDLLPGYMIPVQSLVLPVFPLTGNGKVDERALAQLALPAAPEFAGTAPASAEMIAAIWTRILGHDEFEPDDDFFDVGGDSLLASWVVAELSQALGQRVDLSVFLEDSSIDGLLTALAESAVDSTGYAPVSQIVTLRPGPSTRALYLMHPLGGELVCYRELAKATKSPLRALGVGWAGEPPVLGQSLQEIAAVHRAQLRTIQPSGPYLLAGWSFGGVLAYELAQQLLSAGEEVEFLGLLDANPVLDPLTASPLADTEHFDLLSTALKRIDDDAGDGAELARLTTDKAWTSLMGAPIPAGAPSAYLRRSLQVAQACMRAAMDYSPGRYSGPLDLFQAEETVHGRQESLAGELKRLCTGRFEVVCVPGDHWGITRSAHATAVAAAMDIALARAGELSGNH